MSDSQRIINFIGAAILLTVLGGLVLSGMGKPGPDWSGDLLKVGIGALGGAVVGGGTVYALKPRNPQDPTPKEKEEEAP